MGTQPHPAVDRLPKVFLKVDLPLNILLGMSLITKGTNPAPATSGQAPVPPTIKPPQASRLSSPTRVQIPEARGITVPQPVEWRPQTQKVDKMRQQRKMLKMKEQDKIPEEQLSELEIGNLPEKELRIIIVKST